MQNEQDTSMYDGFNEGFEDGFNGDFSSAYDNGFTGDDNAFSNEFPRNDSSNANNEAVANAVNASDPAQATNSKDAAAACATSGDNVTTPGERVPINREILEATIDVIRESLQADGGDVVLVNVSDDGVVTLEMTGACAGCPLSEYDMTEGIERILKEHVPGVTKVEPAMMW